MYNNLYVVLYILNRYLVSLICQHLQYTKRLYQFSLWNIQSSGNNKICKILKILLSTKAFRMKLVLRKVYGMFG